MRSDKQKQRLTELEVEVAALSNADKGTRGERAALLQRNATLQACHSACSRRDMPRSTLRACGPAVLLPSRLVRLYTCSSWADIPLRVIASI